ncbi:guanine nucleotide binding protein, alpha subunit [Massariosphaeria phaeospora]|uniref:Guanine nucleotide binding protein, alpha subunit n=1 Tax=Massariosphaeria phaeospora TaxID=100035 RepID=A0A7C8I0T9_9PLEO|nr:guanine nucleotide binding protein, alpha subunit [Massariosphaeria phaeospora]
MQSSQSSDPWLPPRRVLLLGISESGKSTVAKQLQILYNNGFSTEALDHHRRVVFQNIGLILREIVEIMEEHGIEPVQKDNRDIWEWFKAEVSNQPLEPQLGPKLVIAVKSFWKDQCMEKIFSLSNDFCMPCFAPYFIEQIDRIASQDYVPTLLDILKARVKTTGLHESRFQVGLREWHVIDAGGSRSERKKWTHGFERDASIIFVVNLAEYDSYMFEMTHRLQETLTLFESLANLHWFTHSKIILLFTNIDLFKKKLRTIPLSDYCGDCDGGVDATKVLRYLLWRLHCLNHANCRLYPFVAEATDTPRMKTFFEAVADILADDSPSDNPTQLQDEIGKEDSVDELISAAGRFWSGDQHWVS